jgi:PAS domain S-box-containing protein
MVRENSATHIEAEEHHLQRELMEHVRRSPEIFEFIRCTALDGLWYWNLLDLTQAWLDDRFWIKLGYDPTSRLPAATALRDLMHPDDWPKAWRQFEEHLADPSRRYDATVRYRHRDGSTIWVRCRGFVLRDSQGIPYRMIGAHMDVTAVERAKELLEKANFDLEERVRLRTLELENARLQLAEADTTNQTRAAELRQLVDGLPLLVWTCTPEGPCDYVSPQWVAYTGVPESRLLDNGWAAQLHPDDAARVIAKWNASVASGTLHATEFRLRRHDGTYRWFQAQARPLRGPEGEVVKWFGTNVDIHDRKMLEEELRERTAALERSNFELEQFAYIASHDLQEPLRTVTSYVQLLERRYADGLDDRGRQYINHVVIGARKMRSLIVDLLDYSRATMAPPEATSVDANEALASAQALLGALIADTDAQLSSTRLPIVAMDAGSLVRVFQNLLSNAIHYRSSRPPEISVDCYIDDDWATIAVDDNGVGIAPEHQRRIFQMFQRLHTVPDRPGTGVGLALCRRLVERAHGEIWVSSKVGVGSTFYIRLKIAARGDGSNE